MAACKRCCFWPGWKQIVCEYFLLVRVWPAGFRAVNSLWIRCELAVSSLWTRCGGCFALWTRCGGCFALWIRCELAVGAVSGCELAVSCCGVGLYRFFTSTCFLPSLRLFFSFPVSEISCFGSLVYSNMLLPYQIKKRIYLFVSRITFLWLFMFQLACISIIYLFICVMFSFASSFLLSCFLP